jgi:hypothetical protein
MQQTLKYFTLATAATTNQALEEETAAFKQAKLQHANARESSDAMNAPRSPKLR